MFLKNVRPLSNIQSNRKGGDPPVLYQGERLRELGDSLRQARHSQCLSLEEVANKTRIPVRTLQAIEDGRMEQLPEPVYIRGFIRHFGDFLGLNGAELANSFPAEVIARPVFASWQQFPVSQLRPVHLYIIYVLLIMFAVSTLSYLMQRSSTPTRQGLSSLEVPMPPSVEPDVESNPFLSESVVSPTPTTSTGDRPDVKLDRLEVTVTFREQSWIQVTADGKTAYEGVLPEGTQKTWQAQKTLTVRSGNAGGVLLAVNQDLPKVMGSPGTVKELTLTKVPKDSDVERVQE